MNARNIPSRVHGIGVRFRLERLRLGLTQQEVATAAGVARTTIAAAEMGYANLMTSTLADACDLGFNARFVLTGEISVLQRGRQSNR